MTFNDCARVLVAPASTMLVVKMRAREVLLSIGDPGPFSKLSRYHPRMMMRFVRRPVRCLAPIVLLLTAIPINAQESAPPPASEAHVFTIERFVFESGAEVPNVKVAYGTYGRLSADRDNVILLPSHYMADFHGYERLIGPGRALDPTRYFLV